MGCFPLTFQELKRQIVKRPWPGADWRLSPLLVGLFLSTPARGETTSPSEQTLQEVYEWFD